MSRSKFYQVYQAHSPSGGVSAIDETRYATLEEARGAAEAKMSEVTEVSRYSICGREYAYPAFWAQALSEENGIIYLEFS